MSSSQTVHNLRLTTLRNLSTPAQLWFTQLLKMGSPINGIKAAAGAVTFLASYCQIPRPVDPLNPSSFSVLVKGEHALAVGKSPLRSAPPEWTSLT